MSPVSTGLRRDRGVVFLDEQRSDVVILKEKIRFVNESHSRSLGTCRKHLANDVKRTLKINITPLLVRTYKNTMCIE